jgi:GAF domain-containing protein
MELTGERNRARFTELAEELNDALAAQSIGEHIEANPQAHQAENNPYLRFGSRAWITDLLLSTMEASTANFGNVQLFDSSRGVLRIAAQKGFSDEFLAHFDKVHSDDGCACGSAMKKRSRIVVTNVATDPVFQQNGSRDVLLRAKVRSVQSTPLLAPSGIFIGVVSTHYDHEIRPSPGVWRNVDDVVADYMAKI